MAATASVHGLALTTTPHAVAADSLADHVGERVSVGVVVDRIDASGHWTRIDGYAGSRRARVMVPPSVPLDGVVPGADLAVDGTIELDAGTVTIFLTRVVAIDTRVPDAVPVSAAVRAAPEARGDQLSVAGNVTAVDGGIVLADSGASLPLAGRRPAGEGPAVAVGRVVYDASTARYVLHVEAWRPWDPPSWSAR